MVRPWRFIWTPGVLQGNIQLSNVGVDNFAGDGILLDNSFGTGSISISGSSQNNIYYNYFGGSGLTLRSNGTVSLLNMSISDNGSMEQIF
jgi:energy-converting hydrogenase Eha subunit H